MKRIFLALCVLGIARLAFADPYLGTIFVYDGGTSNNAVTTRRDAGLQADGGTISDGGSTDFLYWNSGFAIPANRWLTVQCRQDCHVNGDTATCDAGVCPRLYAEQWLSEPIAASTTLNYTAFTGALYVDGGFGSNAATYTGGLVAISPADGGAVCTCQVFLQPGMVGVIR